MAQWDVTPKTVQAPDKTTARRTARDQLAVAKIVAAPPAPPTTYLRRDDCVDPSPRIWSPAPDTNPYGGMADPSRLTHFPSGGPGDKPFRRITVQDGDYVSGERAELAYNTWKTNSDGSPRTFFNYHEGDHRVTEWYFRLADDFPLDTDKWQVICQMKQSGPSRGSGGSPYFSFEARQGQLQVQHNGTDATPGLPRFDIATGNWYSVKVDAVYSIHGGDVTVMLDGTPKYAHFPTLKTEPSSGDGTADPGIAVGDPIPAHLRMGIYHDPTLPGTHIDIADIRVS
jgi:hypothetical protein